METFEEIFAIVFGVFWAIVAVIFAIATYGDYFLAQKNRNKVYPKESDTSNDFMKERENILCVLQDRMEENGALSKQESEFMAKINDSSEFASLIRSAHYAGFSVSFEQNEGPWEEDPEYLDENVFKTDLLEAADLRREKELERFKRNQGPLVSKRERVIREKQLN